MALDNNCVSFYETENSLTAKTAVKERIYEEFYTPPVGETASATTPTAATPTAPKKKSVLWIWAAVAVTALLMAENKKEESID
ncbi:hypothetical protein [Flavobacterium commune]|uniref:Uncharacterized protein n=1 Tax=Flavobacterium commune TaxID=1306519 RepID=A0A1D9PB88_9FLAO|nr:hypothetical protein [Flavobacterium commune]AOZ99594.1 hypothetical protein BIW12_09155 [Flavobacterium commune]